MPPPTFWPRLYLDTADLIEIADGKTPPALIDDLLSASEEHAVVLVISQDHFQDALLPDDPEGVDRLATMLERFRLKGLVVRGPHLVEPWPTAGVSQDISIEGCSNIREIITHPAATPHLALMRETQDAVHRGLANASVVQQATRDITIPRHHRQIALQSTITQVRGWLGDDPVPVVLHHLDLDEGTPTPNEMINLVMAQQPLAELMKEVSPLLDKHGIDRTEAVRRMALSIANDGYTIAPGAWLAGQLVAGLVRDERRPPRRSDMVDVLHAMHFPYVDIASCDAQAYAILSRVIHRAIGSRPAPVSLFRNNRIKDIVAHIRSLPTAIDLYMSQSE